MICCAPAAQRRPEAKRSYDDYSAVSGAMDSTHRYPGTVPYFDPSFTRQEPSG